MRFYCLYNPAAGNKKAGQLLHAIKSLQTKNQFNVEIEELNQFQIQQQLDKAVQFDRLLIAGGDGTISFVLSNLNNRKIIVGLLPLGTGNDLSKELGIWDYFSVRNPEKILQLYQTASPHPLTLWKLRYGSELEYEKIFVNYVSFGFDGSVVNFFTAWRKNRFNLLNKLGVTGNRISYFIASLAALGSDIKTKNIAVRKEDKTYPVPAKNCRTILFANIKSIMGLGISNKTGSAFDDQIEMIIPKTLLSYASMFFKLKCPLPKPIICGSASQWELNTLNGKPLVFQIDGEGTCDISSGRFEISSYGSVNVMSV